MKVISERSKAQSKRILEERTRQGMNQVELSQLTGISVPYISRLEHGRVNVTVKTLLSMSEALNCPIEYLEDGIGTPNTIREIITKNKPEEDFDEDVSCELLENYEIKRIRHSKMKEKEFKKHKSEIKNVLDDILYNSSNETIKCLHTIINKYSEYAFLLKTFNKLDENTQIEYLNRCKKISMDIKNEMDTTVEFLSPDEFEPNETVSKHE